MARARSIPTWLLLAGGASLAFVFAVTLASLRSRGGPRDEGARVGQAPRPEPEAAGEALGGEQRRRAAAEPGRPGPPTLREAAEPGRPGGRRSDPGAPGDGAPSGGPAGGEGAPRRDPLDLRAALGAYDRRDVSLLGNLLAGREGEDDADVRRARGLLHDLRHEYAQAWAALAGLDDGASGRVARAATRAAFLTARYDECRAVAATLPAGEARRWRLLCDGPFRERYPRAAGALEARSDDGRYRVVSDLGLAEGFAAALEQKLAAAKSDAERARLVERARRAHAGLHEVADVMDKAAKAYDRLFSETPPAVVPTVFVFERRADFDAFSTELGVGDTESVLGFYSPEHRVLVFFDQGLGSGRDAAKARDGGALSQATLEVLLHETFHQWLDLFLDRPPPWFNEGLAELFGISRLTREGLRFGLIPTTHPSRLDNIRAALTTTQPVAPLPLAELLQADQATFMRSSQAAINYAQSWSFVHYLAASEGGKKVLRDLFHALRRGLDAPAAYREVFGKLDVPGLEKEWKQHVARMR